MLGRLDRLSRKRFLNGNLLDSDEAKAAIGRVARFYKKQSKVVKKKVSNVGEVAVSGD